MDEKYKDSLKLIFGGLLVIVFCYISDMLFYAPGPTAGVHYAVGGM